MSALAFVYSIWGLAPMAILVAIIYLLVRRKNGQTGITAYHALMTYFYAVIGVSVTICALGAGILLSHGIGRLYDDRVAQGDSATTGLVLLVIGLLIMCVHIWGLKVMRKPADPGTRTVRRVYLFIMLALCSIAGLISIPLAVTQATQRSIDDFGGSSTPQTYLAVALVVFLLWLYFFRQVAMEIREPLAVAKAEDAELGSPGSSA